MNNQLYQLLKKFIYEADFFSPQPFATESWREVIRVLNKLPEYSEIEEISLELVVRRFLPSEPNDLFEEPGRELILRKLEAELTRHPRTYKFVVRLPNLQLIGDYIIELGAGISLVSGPVPLTNNHVLRDATGGSYLCLEVKGWRDGFIPTSWLDSLEEKLKLTIFFLMRDSRFGQTYSRVDPSFMCFDDENHFCNGSYPDRILLVYLNNLCLQLPLKKGQGLLQTETADPQECNDLLKTGWEDFHNYNNSADGLNKRQLGAAIQWFVDGVLQSNQTVAYLNYCIGIEAVLGGSLSDDGNKEIKEMTARLSERYAFMVGRNRDERARLAENYKTVLGARGNLVHGRIVRLERKEQNLLGQARNILQDCIDREVAALAAPEKKRFF